MALGGEKNLPKDEKKPHLPKWTEAIESSGKDEVVRWKCRNCGYVHEGTEAPKTCPACAHPQSHYELAGENY
jgi:rubrerythrin